MRVQEADGQTLRLNRHLKKKKKYKIKTKNDRTIAIACINLRATSNNLFKLQLALQFNLIES